LLLLLLSSSFLWLLFLNSYLSTCFCLLQTQITSKPKHKRRSNRQARLFLSWWEASWNWHRCEKEIGEAEGICSKFRYIRMLSSVRLKSSGMWYHIAWYVDADILEGLPVSIFSVKEVEKYQAAWCHFLEDHTLNIYHWENFTSFFCVSDTIFRITLQYRNR
jgi:hypothetical protein